jgi:hypothetical protein
MRRTLVAFILLIGVMACGDGSLDPLPLEVTVQASRTTATPGDAIGFVVTAQGGTLLSVAIDYGDSTTEAYNAAGARTATVTFSHAYEAVGTYQVVARVADAIAGERDATVEIRVQ